jgi:hypothetical protein
MNPKLIERKHHLKNVVQRNWYRRYYCKSKVENELNMIILLCRPNETNIKQFDKLIAAYAISILTKNIHLVLLGDGELKHLLF